MTIQNMDVYTRPESWRDRRFIVEFDSFLPLEDHHTRKFSMSAEAYNINAEGLVHSMIEQRAKAFPDATALQFERRTTMTYRQLNETANAVARQLVCGRGAFVPIATQRSLNLVVALLAVMKTGAAYVLLSPDAPDKRNKFIVEDLRAPFVITDGTTQGRFGGTTEIRIEDLVAESQRMSTAYRTNLNIYQAHSDYAYVVYTSGTTGTQRVLCCRTVPPAPGFPPCHRLKPHSHCGSYSVIRQISVPLNVQFLAPCDVVVLYAWRARKISR